MDAVTTLAWLRSEIEPLATNLQPALPNAATTSLCEFLRDGRALVLLTAALPAAANDNQQQPQDVAALPKNLQRSLHQTTTFHALERIQFFIKWCRADAALDAFVVFSSVQLLDEQNEKVVAACLEALRNKYRPQLKGTTAAVAAPAPLAISTTTTAPVVAATVVAAIASPATPSKSSGLWVKRSSAHQLLASPASSRNNSDSSNQSSHESSSVAHPTVSSLNNRLNAFLNKFPSETNVLTAAAPVVAAVASPVGVDEAVQPQDDDEDDDEDNNVEEEAVETYNEDEEDEDVAAPTQPRAPFADALSPRSEHERSSFGSSLSFSFTSDPRHHESLTEDAPRMNLSFSSVLSSPPASPKPAPRVRIPSVFERNAEKAAAAAAAAAVEGAAANADRSSATSSATKDEAPRAVSKLNIPAAFSSSSSSTISIESTASETVAASAVVPETTAAATPKPVSKLNIPAAFARSSSTSSNASDRSSFSKPTTTAANAVVGQETSTSSSPQPALVKKPSRLKIPSAFASGATVAVTAAPAPVDEPVAEAAVEKAAEEEPATRSPLAAFVASPSASHTTSSSPSTSSSRPANKLAAFLSTVEVANAFVTAAMEPSSDNGVATKELADQQERFSDDESDSDESVDVDEPAAAEVRFSLSQETAIGLPDDSGLHGRVHHSLSLSAAPPTTNEVAPEDQGEQEEHSIDHHDHTDSEQPFFVVEEVSLSKPATSTKLYAFLSAVDSTESPRFSHTSSVTGDDKTTLDEAAAIAVAHLSHGSQRNSVEGHTTASEHSERSPSNSVTSQPLAAASASSDVILEKERLSGENLALQLKLRTVEARLSAKDVEAAALQAGVVALQAQLAAAATPSGFRLKSAAEAFKAQVAEVKAVHVKTIKVAQAAREQFLSEKKLLEDQLRSIKAPSQSVSAVTALSAQLAEVKAAHLKTIKTAQATREQFANQTKLLENQLRVMKQQSNSAAAAFSSRLAEANKAHVKTIKAAQYSREQFVSENVRLTTLALQKQSAAVALQSQVAELKKAHLKTIKTSQFSREQLLASGTTPVGQTTTTVAVHQDGSTLSTLAEQNRAFEQKLQAAKDSEEAARNSVQLALMELIRSQQATITQLSHHVT